MDVLESYISIKASPDQVRPFITVEPWIESWLAPSAELVEVSTADGTLVAGATFDVVLNVPTSPVFYCRVERANAQELEIHCQGVDRGVATWHLLPAGRETVVRLHFEYELTDRRWLLPWALIGRWVAVLYLGYLLRRLKGRVQDTVGSSSFGLPLIVSRYALAAGGAVAALVLGLLVRRVLKWFSSRR